MSLPGLQRRKAAARVRGRARAGMFVLLGMAALGTAQPVAGQDLHPSRRPSPIGIARTHVGDTYVKVTYGRPYIRGRDVFGTPHDTATFLVPFGELWRTGANEATELTTTGPITVAGQPLAAGTYSVFTVPGPQTWEVRFSPQVGLDGTGRLNEATGAFEGNVYDESRDVLRVQVPATTTDDVVDQLTLSFEPGAGGADLVLRWESTEVRIPITASN